jgi:hypothetical protein
MPSPNTEILPPDEIAKLDHSSHGQMLLTAHWTLTSFAGVFLIFRLWTKVAFKRGLWWDDWVLIGGWVCLRLITGRKH